MSIILKNYVKIILLSAIILGGVFILSSKVNACAPDMECFVIDEPLPQPEPKPEPKPEPEPIIVAQAETVNTNDNANKNTNTNNVVVSNTNTNTQSQSVEVKVKVEKEKSSKKSKHEKKEASKKKATTITKKLPRTGSSTAGLAGLGLVSCISALGIKRYFWRLA